LTAHGGDQPVRGVGAAAGDSGILHAALRSVKSPKSALSLTTSFCRLLHQPENRRLNPRRQFVPLFEDLEYIQLRTLCASLCVLPLNGLTFSSHP
jgi:hypothetical protein